MKKIILQFDGGGIRAVVSLTLLQQINIAIKDISLISGTSTGGILAILLSKGYTIKECFEFYKKQGPKVFKKKFNFFGITNKYDIGNITTGAREYFSNNLFSTLPINTIVPSYNLSKGEVKLFKSTKESADTIVDAISSTVAAPTYFNPYIYNGDAMIDGGVYANCSAQIALNELISQGEKLDNIILISIGTGETNLEVSIKNPNLIQLLKYQGDSPLINSCIDGTTDVQIYNLNQLKKAGLEFYRVQVSLPKELSAMDNVGNINALIDFTSKNLSVVDTLNERLKYVTKL